MHVSYRVSRMPYRVSHHARPGQHRRSTWGSWGGLCTTQVFVALSRVCERERVTERGARPAHLARAHLHFSLLVRQHQISLANL